MRIWARSVRKAASAWAEGIPSLCYMCNLYKLTKMAAAILLIAVWTSGARADPADTTARALVVDWKDGDREMAPVAENQAMSILESFIADHPEMADKTYGLALSASLRQAFPCAPS